MSLKYLKSRKLHITNVLEIDKYYILSKRQRRLLDTMDDATTSEICIMFST